MILATFVARFGRPAVWALVAGGVLLAVAWCGPARLHSLVLHDELIVAARDGAPRMVTRRDGRGVVRDMTNGKEIVAIQGDLKHTRADGVISSDGRWMAVMDPPDLLLWDLTTGLECPPRPVALDGSLGLRDTVPKFSPDGRWLAAFTRDQEGRGGFKVWALAGGAERAGAVLTRKIHDRDEAAFHEKACSLWPHADGPMAFSPDGRLLAFAAPEGEAKGGMEPKWPVLRARMWDVEAGREVAWLRDVPGKVLGVFFSPDGGTLATLHLDIPSPGPAMKVLAAKEDPSVTGRNVLRLWDAAGGKPRGCWLLPGDASDVRFDRDGVRVIATGELGRALFVVDLAQGGPAETSKVEGPVLPSPDGRVLAFVNVTGGGPAFLREFDNPDAGLVVILLSGREFIFNREFSPGGRYLVFDHMWLPEPAVKSNSNPFLRRVQAGLSSWLGWATRFAGDKPLSSLQAYETATGKLAATLPDRRNLMVYGPDDRTVLFWGGKEPPTLWELTPRRPWGGILGAWAILMAGLWMATWCWRRWRARRKEKVLPQIEPGAS